MSSTTTENERWVISDDDLLCEIYDNVKGDRLRIKGLLDEYDHIAKTDPLTLVGAADQISKLQDCMIKSNSQLVELLKTRVKSNGSPKGEGLTGPDRDNMYDQIGGQQEQVEN